MQVINGKEVFTTIEELVDPKYTALLLIDIQLNFFTGLSIADSISPTTLIAAQIKKAS